MFAAFPDHSKYTGSAQSYGFIPVAHILQMNATINSSTQGPKMAHGLEIGSS
jgi:hypothetical protein